MDTNQITEDEFNLISTQMIDGKYVITADSPEYIRNNYDLLELSLWLERTDVIDYASEEVLLNHPKLMNKALSKGYIINPKSPKCIKTDKYLIDFLSRRIYQEGNETDLYVVSCLRDITKLNNINLYNFINCATKEQLTPDVLKLFLKFPLILSIKKRLWNIIINNRSLIDVLLTYCLSDGSLLQLNYIVNAFFPRNILNNTTEENLDYVLKFMIKAYNEDFGNMALLKYKLQYLKSKNDDVFLKSLKMNLLTSQYSFFGIETLNCMMNDMWICNRILELNHDNSNRLEVLEIILSIYEGTSISINELIYLLLDNGLNIHRYEELFKDIKYLYKVSFSTQKEIINNLVSILINVPDNDYRITEFKQLTDEQLLKKRKNFFDSSSAPTVRLCLLKKYNLSLDMARTIVRRYNNTYYGTDFSKYLPDSLRDIIIDIDNMYEKIDDYDRIIELYNSVEVKPIDINISVFLEQRIRAEYIKAFDRKLYRPVEEDRLLAFDKLGVPVYEVSKEFGILAHTIHPYYNDIYDEDIYKDWNRPNNIHHGICCCYITNQNMSTPDSDKLLVGFSHLEEHSILLMAPYDMHSNNTSYASTYETSGCFCFPDDLINNTRDMHCEVTIERKNLVKGITYKRQPDYFIYKADVDGELTPEIVDDTKWRHTVESAKKFNIPIVIVNEKKIIKSEQNLIALMLTQIMDNNTYELIPELIVRFVNNIYSCQCRYGESKKNIIFRGTVLDELIDSFISLIEFHIETQDYDNATKIIDLLIEALDNEIKKIFLGRKIAVSMYIFEQYRNQIMRFYNKIPDSSIETLKKRTY